MQRKWLQRLQHPRGPPLMLVTVPHASPSQDVTRASSVPSRQEGTLGAQSQHVQHGDRVDTHIAIVVDYAARWPRGPGGSWGAWGSLWGARRFVKVLQSGQSPPRRGPRTAPEGQPAPERGRHVPFAGGIGVLGETLRLCAPPAGPAAGGLSAHPQAQHVRGVALLALQPVHAGTSLRMSSAMSLVPVPLPAPGVTAGALESARTPWHHLRHPGTAPSLRDTAGLGAQRGQDVQTGRGTRRRRWPGTQTNREQVLRVCPESRSLPSSLLVPGDPGTDRRRG